MSSSSRIAEPSRGALVSTESINGVGKTYLISQVAAALRDAGTEATPLIVEEFSRRAHDDYETVRDALQQDRLVLEGRSLHTVAVYQSLILHPDDDAAAHDQARQILVLAASWRPLPDLTILVTDDVDTAVRRAEQRDGTPYTPQQWRLHHRAATLFDRLATDEPDRIRVLDRRTIDAAPAIARMRDWIAGCRAVGTARVEPITPVDGALAVPAADAAR